jgi:hypothetical protein
MPPFAVAFVGIDPPKAAWPDEYRPAIGLFGVRVEALLHHAVHL